MVIGTYISIITLNVNGLNAPTKRHRLAEWVKDNNSYINAVYNKPTWDFKTQIDWKRMEKYISCKLEAKESMNSNPHIRQNRP